MSLPYNEEGIAIDVPRLNGVLPVLEDDLDELMEVGAHDGGMEVGVAAGGVGGDAADGEDARDVEVVGQLQWGVRGNVGDAVDGVPLLAVDVRGRVGEDDGSSGFDQSVVVRALWVRSRPACGQVSPGFVKTQRE